MSLATRCTSCNTAFRVVRDQLEVSEGWVRCGRCGEVFNALGGLFDLEREAPSESTPSTGGDSGDGAGLSKKAIEDAATADATPQSPLDEIDGARPDSVLGRPHLPGGGDSGTDASNDRTDPLVMAFPPLPFPSETDSDGEDCSVAGPGGDSSLEEQIDAHLFGAPHTARRRAPVPLVRARDQIDFSDARFDSDLLEEDATADEPPDPNQAAPREESALEVKAPPEFVRRAESRARWRRPSVRVALSLIACALLAALTLQVGHHFRDLAAARWPATRPALAQWCGFASCTIEPLRHIEDITVESTALAKAPGSEDFRLAVTLKSRSNVAVAMPWIDLSLTDESGKLVARKALAAAEFTPAAAVLQPGAEIALEALLSARNAAVTGYTVEIFYP